MEIYDKLKKYFDETPKEKVLKDWEESKVFDTIDSHTVEQFLLCSSSLQLKNQSKSFLSVKSLVDLERLYPNYKNYKMTTEGGFEHYFVDGVKVHTRALIV